MKRTEFELGDPIGPENNPEHIYHYITAAWNASRELLDIMREFKAFERAQENATPEEMQLLRVCLELVREPLMDVEHLTATEAEIAKCIDELLELPA